MEDHFLNEEGIVTGAGWQEENALPSLTLLCGFCFFGFWVFFQGKGKHRCYSRQEGQGFLQGARESRAGEGMSPGRSIYAQLYGITPALSSL